MFFVDAKRALYALAVPLNYTSADNVNCSEVYALRKYLRLSNATRVYVRTTVFIVFQAFLCQQRLYIML